MKPVSLFAGAGVLLLSAACLAAAESPPVTMTYNDLLTRLGKGNPHLQVLDLSERAAFEKGAQSGAYPNPEISYEKGKTSGGGATGHSDLWGVSQEVDYSFRWLSRKKGAKSAAMSEAAGIAGERIAFKRETVRLYHSLQSLAVETLVMDAKRRGAASLLARVEQDRESGISKPGEWRRVQVASRLAEVELLEIDRRIRADSLRLAVRLGYGAGMRVVPADSPAFREKKLDENEFLEKTLAGNPELRRARLELETARARKALAVKESLPGLTVNGSRESGDGGEESRIGLFLSVPLWDRKGAARSAASLEVESLEQRLKNLEAGIAVEAKVAWENLIAARRKVSALRPGLAEADELIRGAETRFGEGKMPLTAFLDALSAAYEIKHQYLSSILNYEECLLDFAGLTADDSYFQPSEEVTP